MDNALRYFPWDCLHIVRVLPNGHWFYTHYDYLTRTPTVQELSMRDAPEGLLNDEDYYDELELRLLVKRIRAARDNIRDVHQQGSAIEDEGVVASVSIASANVDRRDGVYHHASTEEHGSDGYRTEVVNAVVMHDLNDAYANVTNYANYPLNDMVQHGIPESEHWPAAPSAANIHAVYTWDSITAPDTAALDPVHIHVDTPRPYDQFQGYHANHAGQHAVSAPAETPNIAPVSYENMPMNDEIMPQYVGLDGRQVIRMPQTEAERVMLRASFREEILQGEVNDVIAMHGIEGNINAHDLAVVEISEALRTNGSVGSRPYIVRANITRHDWNRAGNCIYTIVLDGVRYRGSGEDLDVQFFGLRRALWEYII